MVSLPTSLKTLIFCCLLYLITSGRICSFRLLCKFKSFFIYLITSVRIAFLFLSFRLFNIIIKGNYSTVWLGKWKEQEVAIKLLTVSLDSQINKYTERELIEMTYVTTCYIYVITIIIIIITLYYVPS